MSNVVRTAGVAGTFNYTLSQAPAQVPTLTIYSDAARTVVAVAATPLTATANPAVFTGAYPASLPAGTYFLSFSVVMTVGQPPFVDNDDTLELRAVSGNAGSTYVSVDDVRALPEMASDARYSDEEIAAAISWFETRFERYTGVAWVARSATDRIDGSGQPELWLSRYPVLSVTAVRVYTTPTASTAYTAAELADLVVDPSGYIRRFSGALFPRGHGNIEVDYTHGITATPDDVVDACLVAVKQKLIDDKTGGRANRQYAVATGDGIAISTRPGDGRPFGIDPVDVVANDRRAQRVPAIG